MDVQNFPKYINKSNFVSPYLLQPSKLLAPEVNRFFGTGSVDSMFNGLLHKIFPRLNLPPDPHFVRRFGMADVMRMTDHFNEGKMNIDLGNLERGRPPVTNSAMWSMDDWNKFKPNDFAEKIMYSSEPQFSDSLPNFSPKMGHIKVSSSVKEELGKIISDKLLHYKRTGAVLGGVVGGAGGAGAGALKTRFGDEKERTRDGYLKNMGLGALVGAGTGAVSGAMSAQLSKNQAVRARVNEIYQNMDKTVMSKSPEIGEIFAKLDPGAKEKILDQVIGGNLDEINKAIEPTYLHKELFNKLIGKTSAEKEVLTGGRADGESDNKYNNKELAMGIEEEGEHTNNKKMEREIAKDHLEENPRYYTYLEKMKKVMNGEAQIVKKAAKSNKKVQKKTKNTKSRVKTEKTDQKNKKNVITSSNLALAAGVPALGVGLMGAPASIPASRMGIRGMRARLNKDTLLGKLFHKSYKPEAFVKDYMDMSSGVGKSLLGRMLKQRAMAGKPEGEANWQKSHWEKFLSPNKNEGLNHWLSELQEGYAHHKDTAGLERLNKNIAEVRGVAGDDLYGNLNKIKDTSAGKKLLRLMKANKGVPAEWYGRWGLGGVGLLGLGGLATGYGLWDKYKKHHEKKANDDEEMKTYIGKGMEGAGVAGGLGSAALFQQYGGFRGLDPEIDPRVLVIGGPEKMVGNPYQRMDSFSAQSHAMTRGLQEAGLEARHSPWLDNPKDRLSGIKQIIKNMLNAGKYDAVVSTGHGFSYPRSIAGIGKMQYRQNSDFNEGNFLNSKDIYDTTGLAGQDAMAVRENPKRYDRFFTPAHEGYQLPEEFQGKLPGVTIGNIPVSPVYAETAFATKDWSPKARKKAFITLGGGNAAPQVFDELGSDLADLAAPTSRRRVTHIPLLREGRKYDLTRRFFLDDIVETLNKAHPEGVDINMVLGAGTDPNTGKYLQKGQWGKIPEFYDQFTEYLKTPEGKKRFPGVNLISSLKQRDLPGMPSMANEFATSHYNFVVPGSTSAEIMAMPGGTPGKTIALLPNDAPEGFMKHFPVNARVMTESDLPNTHVWNAADQKGRMAALEEIIKAPIHENPARTEGFKTDFSKLAPVIREDVKRQKIKNIKNLAMLGGVSLTSIILGKALSLLENKRNKRIDSDAKKTKPKKMRLDSRNKIMLN